MKRPILAFLAAVSVVAPASVVAQEGPTGRQLRAGGPNVVETIMRQRDRLELSDDQIAQLDEIRREAVSERSAIAAETAEMRSQLNAGQIRRSDLMAYMEDLRDSLEGVAEERADRIQNLLTEEQQEMVQQSTRRRGAAMRRGARGPDRGVRGRAGVRRQGFRGGGSRRGFRGPRGPWLRG